MGFLRENVNRCREAEEEAEEVEEEVPRDH